MSDDWESEDFVPIFDNTKNSDKWQGEDEEEDVKDNWEDEDEAEKEDKENVKVPETQTTKRKSKNKLAKKIAAKEAENNVENEETPPLTAEQQLQEKQRVQALQESADLKLAREMLGVAQSIDVMNPQSKSEFDSFKDALVDKITAQQKSQFFPVFLENLLTSLASISETEELKKLGLIFTNMYHERNRQLKEEKKKKQKKKATLNVGGRDEMSDLVDVAHSGTFDDYADDFM